MPDDARPLYHAALSWSAASLVTLTETAADLLRAAGVESPARVLAPLLGAGVDTALREGAAALTGPVARGDSGTVRVHLAALAAASPELIPAYVALARLTADRAIQSGRLDPTAAAALLGVLATSAPQAER